MKTTLFSFVCLFFILACSPFFAATLIHDFQFNDNLSDALSPAGTLTVYGSPTTQGYSSVGYQGAKAWYWTKNSSPGAGLCMHTNIASSTSYSLGFRFKLDAIRSGYGKLVSFRGHQSNHSFSSDDGFYLTSGTLCLYVGGSNNGTLTLSANTLYDIIFVKNGTSVTVYAGLSGSSLSSRLTYNDTGGAFNSSNVFGLMYDDTSTNTEYFTGGSIDAVRVWDGALTAGEVSQNLLSQYYFRTKDSGSWSTSAIWQKSINNSDWVDSDVSPNQDAVNVYIRSGHTVTLTGAASCMNLTLMGGTLNLASNNLSVSGTLTEESGTLSGGTPQVDGYSSPGTQYLSFPPTGNIISGFSAVSQINAGLMPMSIKRYWQLSGTYTGSKLVTFYWDEADDNYYDWVGLGRIPLLYKGGFSVASGDFDVASNPRWMKAFIESSMTKDIFTITTDLHTLPVELSSFTAVVNAEQFVVLHWTTQSESNVAGYYVYRGDSNNLNSAQAVSPLIYATNTTSNMSYSFVDREVEPGVWYYWLHNLDINGHSEFYGPVIATITNTNEHDAPNVILPTAIRSIYPNPFSNRASISYDLDKKAEVEIRIYNIKGMLIKTIGVGEKSIGAHNTEWDGRDNLGKECASGIYYVKLSTGTQHSFAKVVIVK